MQPSIPHGNQQRLSEEKQEPCCNGKAVDEVEPKHGWIDQSATIAGARCDEPAETHKHDDEKDSARGAIEPAVNFHFAPRARWPGRLLKGETATSIPHSGLI